MGDDEVKPTLSQTDERRYAVLSKSTIARFAESHGHDLGEEVTRVLAEDVNFRLRELVSEATQFMKHSKRTKLCLEDIDHALQDANVRSIVGNGGDHTSKYTHVQELNMHCLDDKPVDLIHLSSKEIKYEKSHGSTLTDEWLTPLSSAASTPNMQMMQSLSNYFNEITEVIAGSDEQLRQVALADLMTNSRLSHIQSQILDFIKRWSSTCVETERSFYSMLQMLDAFTNNPHILLSAKVHIDVIVRVLMQDVCLNQRKQDHVECQQLAALILAKVLKWRYNNTDVKRGVVAKCCTVLNNPSSTSRCVLGASLIVACLGPETVAETITPSALKMWLEKEDETEPLALLRVKSSLIDVMNVILKVPTRGISRPQNTVGWLTKIACSHFPHLLGCRMNPGHIDVATKLNTPKRNLLHIKPGKFKPPHEQTLLEAFPERSLLVSKIHINYGKILPVKSQPSSLKTDSWPNAQTNAKVTIVYQKFLRLRNSKLCRRPVRSKKSPSVCLHCVHCF